jgi:hypothetical protein
VVRNTAVRTDKGVLWRGAVEDTHERRHEDRRPYS